MEEVISKQKVLAALRMAISTPDPDNQNREMWQMGQNNLAANLYGRIGAGEFDVDDE